MTESAAQSKGFRKSGGCSRRDYEELGKFGGARRRSDMKDIKHQKGWFVAMCVGLRLRAEQSLEDMSLSQFCRIESITANRSLYLSRHVVAWQLYVEVLEKEKSYYCHLFVPKDRLLRMPLPYCV